MFHRFVLFVSILAAACLLTCPIYAADSLRTADTVYVIPAGPVAGTFTHDARISVADTVAGWARIHIEGWVPVGAVMDRLTAPIPAQIGSVATPDTKQKPPPRQCEAITRKGPRCTRNAVKGSRFCWQHTPK